MKTQLPEKIKTRQEAENFLTELYENGELFHPEDDARDIDWNMEVPPTKEEKTQLNKLMDDIYDLPEMADYPSNKEWDACGFCIDELGWLKGFS